jgi:branched-chain amino acid transport system ATP-binding protein
MRILEVVGLTKRFGRRTALDAVSFTVEEGQILGLFGPRGAGKSTCCDCLSGFIAPDGGRIILDGREITGIAPHQVARAGVAHAFQTARPFKRLTAADNVAVALGRHRFDVLAALLGLRRREAAHRQVLALLDRVGLGAHAACPAGLLTPEMQKRLEVARALARRPRLLLLDEPFDGLSDEERPVLAEIFAGLRSEGLTIVLVEHRMDAAMELADRAVVLDRGTLIASGSPERVRSDAKVIEAYLREDAGADR